MKPILTIFTVGLEGSLDCLDALTNLSRQTIANQLELILFADSIEPEVEQIAGCFHSFQHQPLVGRRTFGDAFEEAVKRANAEHITYAEEHGSFGTDWAEQLMEAHGRGYPVVGFTMWNQNPETLTSWAHFFGQFGQVAGPVASGEVDFLAGHHVSYRRDLLLTFGADLRRLLEDEAVLFLRLKDDGIPLYLCGEAHSYHLNISELRNYVALEFTGQRSFAATRAEQPGWNRLRTLVYLLACPLIPIVRLMRILTHLFRARRHVPLFPKILLPMVPALIAGVLGEACGYLFGAGRSAENKIPLEFQRRTVLASDDPNRVAT